jgi:hypothetical protein
VTTFAADGRHVGTIAAHRLAAFAAGDARFVGSEFVGGPFRVGGSSAFARNLPLFARVH